MSTRSNFLGLVIGLGVMLAAAAAGEAQAGCNTCTPPPPPCCAPPKPPPTPCCNGGHNIIVPGVNVVVAPSVVVNSSAQAIAVSSARASSQSQASVYLSGGVNVVQSGQVTTSLIQNINVEGALPPPVIPPVTPPIANGGGGGEMAAACIDDRAVPHPASQVQPGRNVPASYSGEVYRCIAGTAPQATIGDHVMNCAKGDAIFRTPEGEIVCRPATKQRDCFERSLLRRYGAGTKLLPVIKVAQTAPARAAARPAAQEINGSLALDGGVGGFTY